MVAVDGQGSVAARERNTSVTKAMLACATPSPERQASIAAGVKDESPCLGLERDSGILAPSAPRPAVNGILDDRQRENIARTHPALPALEILGRADGHGIVDQKDSAIGISGLGRASHVIAADYDAILGVFAEAFAGISPACTAIQAGLFDPDILVEMDMDAMVS